MIDNISIIGGGIAGLVTALSFEKLNIPYHLYERAPQIDTIGAGIWLSPNALQVLEWINPQLLNDILKTGNPLKRIMVADHLMNPISDSDQNFVYQKFGYTTTAIHRGQLQQLLLQYISTKNITLNKDFKSFKSLDNDLIQIDFTDEESIKSKSLIGADGIRSKVRTQLFPDSQIRYSGQTCWRGVSDTHLDINHQSMGFTLWGQKLQFGVSQISNGKVYWFAVKQSPQNQKDDKSQLKKQLLQLFSQYHPTVSQLIENTSTDQILRSDLCDLELLQQWNKKGICLIGDAAHSMTPDLGQGGVQAIEDAFYLSHFIHTNSDIEQAFKHFYNFRKPKVEKLVKQSRFTSKIAITNKFMEYIRNFILKSTPEKIMQKQMIELYQLDPTILQKHP